MVHDMRLERLQNYLREKGWKYSYAESDGCGSIDWEHRGLRYHVWEFPENGAESNVKNAGKMEDFTGNYEEQIIKIIKGWDRK